MYNLKEDVGILGNRYKWKEAKKKGEKNIKLERLLGHITGYKTSLYRRYVLLYKISMINSVELGVCILSVTEIIINSEISQTQGQYTFLKERLWKIQVYQKSKLKTYEITLTDFDFLCSFEYFSKREKHLYDIFKSTPMTKGEKVKSLTVLGDRMTVQQGESGLVLHIRLHQKPNPIQKANSALYFPLKEFLRQKTIISEYDDNRLTQYTTNARQVVLVTTVKYSTGVYLTVTVYYMIPIGKYLYMQ